MNFYKGIMSMKLALAKLSSTQGTFGLPSLKCVPLKN